MQKEFLIPEIDCNMATMARSPVRRFAIFLTSKRRRIATLLMLCFVCVSCENDFNSRNAEPYRAPNIILIMSDDQGWGDTGYNGHPFVKTPNLDEMASASLRMDRFYAAAPVCSPTRGSVLTGRNPNRINILNHGHYLRRFEVTIADVLKKQGYVTGMFGKWHVGAVHAGGPANPGKNGFDEWIVSPNYFDLDPWLSDKGVPRQYAGEGSRIIVDEAIKFIRKHVNRPTFTVIWFASPHVPHMASPPESQMYTDMENQGYYQEITALDSAVGDLRQELRRLDLSENTLVWFTSDNGGLVEKTSGGRGTKGSIYEGGLRVPALLEWPKRIKPGSTMLPMTTSDIFPTLAAVAGVQSDSAVPLDGVDLLPYFDTASELRPGGLGFWRYSIRGQSTPSEKIMKDLRTAIKRGENVVVPPRIKKQYKHFPVHSEQDFPGHSAWLVWPWKLHRIENDKQIMLELYDLQSDPMESTNVISTNDMRVREMNNDLKKWLKSVTKSLNGEDYCQANIKAPVC